MDTVLPLPVPATLGVSGTEARFPVRRVYCVGRNYRDHAVEMGDDPDRNPPFFFAKPADAVVDCGRPGVVVPYPPQTTRLEHEIELAVGLRAGGTDLSEAEALEAVFGYAVSLDLTRRDLQQEAKDLRRPWDLAKGFDHSAPIGRLHPVSEVGHLDAGRIALWVDGELRQSSDLGLLIWSTAELIAGLSRSVRLAPGDLILTGTPAGVGLLDRGAAVRGTIAGLSDLECTVGL